MSEQVKVMPHVPNKVTQHGLHVREDEYVRPTLKPGQTDIHRRGFYNKLARANLETYLGQDKPAVSTYKRDMSTAPLSDDYKDPVKPYIPPLQILEDKGGAYLWQSEYAATTQEVKNLMGFEVPHKHGPPIGQGGLKSFPRRAETTTSYLTDFGEYGTDPRDRLEPGATSLPVPRSEMHQGTTRGSGLVPGYQGHLPAHGSAMTERLARDGRVDYSKFPQEYHHNIVGYSGHVPHSARNMRGGRKPTALTTMGHDFIRHKCLQTMVADQHKKK